MLSKFPIVTVCGSPDSSKYIPLTEELLLALVEYSTVTEYIFFVMFGNPKSSSFNLISNESIESGSPS